MIFAKMASVAFFDFDRTIVDDDSDATIINKLREKKPPPDWESSNHDWTPYMSDVSVEDFIFLIKPFFINLIYNFQLDPNYVHTYLIIGFFKIKHLQSDCIYIFFFF